MFKNTELNRKKFFLNNTKLETFNLPSKSGELIASSISKMELYIYMLFKPNESVIQRVS
jgi:hypothetical protein